MTTRLLLRNVFKIQYLNYTKPNLNFRHATLCYATKIKQSATANLCLPVKTITSNTTNFSSIKVDVKENLTETETLFRKLHSQYQANGSINADIFKKLLAMLNSDSNNQTQLSAEQTKFLLSACSPLLMPTQESAVRIQLFENLWQRLSKSGQKLSEDYYQIKLQVLQSNCVPLPDVQQLLKELEYNEVNINTPELYEKLLSVACSSGNIRQATQILTEMRNKNYPLNENNFNCLILGHARNNDLNNSNKILENMIAAGVPVSTETQTMLIIAHLENYKSSEAKEILNKYHGQFNASQILLMLRTCLYTEIDLELIAQLIREIPTQYLVGPEVPLALKNLCIELMYNGKLPIALNIISTLPNPVFNENQHTDTFGVFLIYHLFHIKCETEKIIEIAKMLIDSGKNARALHIATELAMRKNPPLGIEFLKTLSKEEPLRPHYFWPLLMYNFRRHGESGIIRTLTIMSDLKAACDEDTLIQYILPRLSLTLDDPIKACKLLDRAGLKPSQILPIILEYIITQGKLENIVELVELYPTKFDLNKLVVPLSKQSVNVRAMRRYMEFAKMLSALTKRNEDSKSDFVGQILLHMVSTQSRLCNDLETIIRYVRPMHRQELKISHAAVNGILTHINNVQNETKLDELKKMLEDMSKSQYSLPNTNDKLLNVNTSSFVKHPRDMSLEELECHLIELETKKLNTRGILRRLLQMCVREERLERALEIKAKCEELHVDVSPGMMASILDMYIKLKDLENAKNSLLLLQRTFPGFNIDEHKVVDYAALLVHKGQLQTGIKVLEERAKSHKIIGGEFIMKNIWNYLTNVAQYAGQEKSALDIEQNLTRENFDFLRQLGYCKPYNALLGPIVREYLLRGELKSAIAEFQQLADKYKHTPLQYEILSLLVRLSNSQSTDFEQYQVSVEDAQSLLTNVISTITKVHGQINLNSALLLAFAESGTDNQLRRLMLNPEFCINQELLQRNCEHLGDVGSIQTLLRLGRCARGLRIIDEQRIYDMLLNKFTKVNNFSAALDLYERLEADDELKISQEFLRNLVNLLKFNNVNIPSNIALRAQVI